MEVVYQQILLKQDVVADKRRLDMDAVSSMRESLLEDLWRRMDLAFEKGASVWLSCLPIAEYGFCSHKRAFADPLSLRYGWSPTNTPLNCAYGGVSIYKAWWNLWLDSSILSEVCSDIKVEPDLQPVPEGVSFAASANVSEWLLERMVWEIRIFNPHAPTNRLGSIPSTYLKYENEKKRLYE